MASGQVGNMTRDEARLRAEAIAVMRMNGWDVLDIARKLRIPVSTVRNALRGRKKRA